MEPIRSSFVSIHSIPPPVQPKELPEEIELKPLRPLVRLVDGNSVFDLDQDRKWASHPSLKDELRRVSLSGITPLAHAKFNNILTKCRQGTVQKNDKDEFIRLIETACQYELKIEIKIKGNLKEILGGALEYITYLLYLTHKDHEDQFFDEIRHMAKTPFTRVILTPISHMGNLILENPNDKVYKLILAKTLPPEDSSFPFLLDIRDEMLDFPGFLSIYLNYYNFILPEETIRLGERYFKENRFETIRPQDLLIALLVSQAYRLFNIEGDGEIKRRFLKTVETHDFIYGNTVGEMFVELTDNLFPDNSLNLADHRNDNNKVKIFKKTLRAVAGKQKNRALNCYDVTHFRREKLNAGSKKEDYLSILRISPYCRDTIQKYFKKFPEYAACYVERYIRYLNRMDLPFTLDLTAYYKSQKKYSDALDVLKIALKHEPENLTCLLEKFRILEITNSKAQLFLTIKKILRSKDLEEDLREEIIEKFLIKYSAADLQEFKEEIAKFPHMRALQAYLEDDLALARSIVETAHKKTPVGNFIKAIIFHTDGDHAAMVKCFEKDLKGLSRPLIDRARPLYLMSLAKTDMRKFWEQTARYIENDDLLLALQDIVLANAVSDIEKDSVENANAVITALLKKYPENSVWKEKKREIVRRIIEGKKVAILPPPEPEKPLENNPPLPEAPKTPKPVKEVRIKPERVSKCLPRGGSKGVNLYPELYYKPSELILMKASAQPKPVFEKKIKPVVPKETVDPKLSEIKKDKISIALMALREIEEITRLQRDEKARPSLLSRYEPFAARLLRYYIFKAAELLKAEKNEEEYRKVLKAYVADSSQIQLLRNFLVLQGHRTDLKSLQIFSDSLPGIKVRAEALVNREGMREAMELPLKVLNIHSFMNEWHSLPPTLEKRAHFEVIFQEIKFVKDLASRVDHTEFFDKGNDIREVLKMSILVIGKMLSGLKLEIKNERLNWILKCSRSVRHQVTFKNAATFVPEELHANTLYRFMTEIEEVFKGIRELEEACSLIKEI